MAKIKNSVNNNDVRLGKSKIKKWETVKIAGNVVSDDGVGLEGMIGLEVLEDYDSKQIVRKKLAQKRKLDDDNDHHIAKNADKIKKLNKGLKVVDNTNTAGRFVLLKPRRKLKNPKKAKLLKKEDIGANNKLHLDDLLEWKNLGVPEPILKSLAEKGFKSPTKIQSLVLPASIIGHKDILGAAETGSGKTLAFGIPIINGILKLQNTGSHNIRHAVSLHTKYKNERIERDNYTPPPEEINNFPVSYDNLCESNYNENTTAKPLYALVLTPTRELAVQVKEHLAVVAKYTGIKVAAIFGGLAHVKQERILNKCPEIVVATPGRLWELLMEGNDHLNKLENINFLVIDETDRMVEKGHFEELKSILNRLNTDPTKKAERQNFVFSATLTLVHELPNYLQTKNMGKKKKIVKQTSAQKILHLIEHLGISQPKVIDITQNRGTAQLLTECRITCQIEQKDLYLYYFLQRHPGRTIVFCNSIDCVRRLGHLFNLLECQPRTLHAQMNQKQRLKNLEKFSANLTGLLIATDVAARGLDIPNVQHVIHYQVPRTTENYVHRSGRTARANSEGIAVLIMEPTEVRDYLKVCKTLGKTEDLPLFPVSDKLLKAVKARVDLARDIDILDLKVRRSQNDIGWLKKAANEMDIIVDDMSDFSENDLYDSDDGGDRFKIKKELKQKRDNLNKLLSKQLFPKGFSYKYPTSLGHLDTTTINIENIKQNAIDVMKNAIKESKIAKKK